MCAHLRRGMVQDALGGHCLPIIFDLTSVDHTQVSCVYVCVEDLCCVLYT
jgi:hypothetical protein